MQNTSLFNKILQGHEIAMIDLIIIVEYFYFNIISDQNSHKLINIFIAKIDFQK
jgi:hypothetical protein